MDIKTIYELLKEVREDQKEHVREGHQTKEAVIQQAADIKNIKQNLDDMKSDIYENKENLREHMQRTYQVEIGQEKMFSELEKLHKDNLTRIETLQKAYLNVEEKNTILAQRVDKLEGPKKAKAWLRQYYLEIVSVITATGSVLALASKIAGWW